MPTGRDLSLKRLKQRGFLLFHTTTGSSIFSPAALTKKAMVNICVDFLPPLAFFPFSTSPLSDKALKKQPDLPIFQIFSDGYSLFNS